MIIAPVIGLSQQEGDRQAPRTVRTEPPGVLQPRRLWLSSGFAMHLPRPHFLITLAAACVSLPLMSATSAPAKPKQPLPSSVFEWSRLEAKPTKVGARRDVFDSPTATLGNLECHVTTVNPGEAPHAAHRHPDEELIFVKEGTLEITADGSAGTAGPGSVVFFAANQLHGMRNPGPGPATYYVVRIVPHDLAAKK